MTLSRSIHDTLAAIVESPDPTITANERLRAISELRELGGLDQSSSALEAALASLPEAPAIA